jgi:DNA processing protein
MRDLGFLNRAQLEALALGPDPARAKEMVRSLADAGAYALCLDDPSYPALLKEIEDPPCVLSVKGSLEDLQPAVAVVGTRAPSHYGKETARTLARDLSRLGVSVVSGLARGVDREAHQGALEGIAGTAAVLGSGIDVMYPPEHEKLADRIAEKGAVLSEFPPGTIPEPGNFPQRNRIISGLCIGTIVIEASIRSGAMITARLAGEQGRLVMAVPGDVNNVRSQGPHHLIRQGAVLVRNAEDVMAEISPQVKSILKNSMQMPKDSDEIVSLVAGSPLSIEEIARELDMSISDASRRISMLEINGDLMRIEGNRFKARSANG